MEFKNRLKTSEIARIAKLNNRTLHYYDEIGLFSPEQRSESGYRYYSLNQLVDLSIILSLKELGMPLKQIKTVLTSDVETTQKILNTKRNDIDKKIQNLTDIKQIIEQKLNFFEIAKKQIAEIQFIDFKEEYFILSEKVQRSTSQNLVKTAYDLMINKGKHFFANNEYGAMFHHKNKDTESYDYFFLKTNDKDDYDFIKPSGCYLYYIYKGNDEGLKNTYSKIHKYIIDNQLRLDGYFYEKTLNETTTLNQEEYITEIQVRVL